MSYAHAVDVIVGWLTPKRLRVYPTAILVLTLATWLISLALGPGLADLSNTIVGADFLAFYMGGRFFLEGRMAELYDFSAQIAFQETLLSPVKPNGYALFVYPPPTALLSAPFALGSYLTGLLLWWAAGLLALAAALHLLRKELMPSSNVPISRLLLVSFLFFPTLASFLYGQTTAFTLFIYTLAFVFLRRRRDLMAGAALGLVLYKPHLTLALWAVLAVKRRWRALVGGALSVGLSWAVVLAISPEILRAFAEIGPRVADAVRSGVSYKTWGAQSFYEFSTLLMDGLWKTGGIILGFLLTAAGLLAIVTVWRRTAWKPGTQAWDLTLAAAIALGVLSSLHLFLYDLALLLVSFAIVWSYYPRGTGSRPLDGGPLLAWTAALYVASFVGSYLTLGQLRLTEALGLPPFAVQLTVPVLVGWTWQVWRIARRDVDPYPNG